MMFAYEEKVNKEKTALLFMALDYCVLTAINKCEVDLSRVVAAPSLVAFCGSHNKNILYMMDIYDDRI